MTTSSSNLSPSEIGTRSSEGTFDVRSHVNIPTTPPTFVKMIVMEVISDPNTVLFDDDKKTTWHGMKVTNTKYVNVLPRNTIIAKLAEEASNPLFVFPFFPSHLSVPCKVGECVWVMIEKPSVGDIEIAYWLCRVVEPHTSDDVNHSHPGRSTEFTLHPRSKDLADNETLGDAESGDDVWHELRNAPSKRSGKDRYTSLSGIILKGEDEDIFETLITETDAAALTTYESVPRFRKRPGDLALEGSNNALIVLGTERTGPLEIKDNKKIIGSGQIDLVVGRGQTPDTSGLSAATTSIKDAGPNKKGSEIKKELNKAPHHLKQTEGDPDLKNDRSRIMVSQKTAVDKNFGLAEYNSSFSANTNLNGPGKITDSDVGDPAIVIKSDKIRLISRSDIEILVTGFDQSVKKAPNGDNRKDENSDTSKWSSIVIKANGDIVFTPAKSGVIKLGGDDADLAILCEKAITGPTDGLGTVTAPPIIDTMGGSQGTGAIGQGQYAKKVLMK